MIVLTKAFLLGISIVVLLGGSVCGFIVKMVVSSPGIFLPTMTVTKGNAYKF